jgi:hypothetical protein
MCRDEHRLRKLCVDIWDSYRRIHVSFTRGRFSYEVPITDSLTDDKEIMKACIAYGIDHTQDECERPMCAIIAYQKGLQVLMFPFLNSDPKRVGMLLAAISDDLSQEARERLLPYLTTEKFHSEHPTLLGYM